MPLGFKPPPRRAPRGLKSDADLRALQRLMLHALVQPLTAADGLQPRWRDGRPMAEVAAEFIKPNGRLTPFERLQIYARCYWFRIIDCAYDDCPGLRAVLGEKKFSALVRAYLTKYPSRSFTLRNLCSRLPRFIREEPRWTAPRTALAHAVARFEWAQTVAFDGEARPVLTADDLADIPPAKLRLALQPYVSLLRLDWPVDDYVLAVKRRNALRGEASHAVDHGPRAASRKRVPRPRRGRVFIVVHRYNERLYYKRVDAAAFKILEKLAAGGTLAQAAGVAGRGVTPEQVHAWFETWMELGWFCRS
ncbi:MAG: putative DNA-binding domain-containing protein [Verrucomicrobia bacterium]|nr:putative DNA-binding domain-containing protein [Verrucomicrobiota bacterium]